LETFKINSSQQQLSQIEGQELTLPKKKPEILMKHKSPIAENNSTQHPKKKIKKWPTLNCPIWQTMWDHNVT
jgi:hypothetical protein